MTSQDAPLAQLNNRRGVDARREGDGVCCAAETYCKGGSSSIPAFALVDRYWKREKPVLEEESATMLELEPTRLTDHAVIVGYGRVGSIVGKGLVDAGYPVLIVEDRDERVTQLHGDGVEVLFANAAERRALNAANLPAARWLFVAIPNSFEAQRIVVHARAVNPGLRIIARAHFDDQVEDLKKHGAATGVRKGGSVMLG